MKLIVVVSIAFVLGAAFGRWDAKHGADVGFQAGQWIRGAVLGKDGGTNG